ncbi:MAG TPA: biopolymer transporter Tol [Kiritimatiellia bacterium]|nr:biopolymer transporter Tol [Kiritimatiellia bacterium]
MIRNVIWMMALIVGFGANSTAQDIVISRGVAKTSVDVAGVQIGNDTGSQTFLQVLKTDISRSGWLELGRAGMSDFILTGRVQFDGSTMRSTLQLSQRGSTRALLSKTYNSDSSGIRRIAHEAADDIVQAITGRRGFASAKIVMVGNRTGSKELYMSDSDGRSMYPVTADKSVSLAPRWSRDGSRIFYTSFLRGFPAIYRIDLATRQRTRISNFSGLNSGGAVSPDGKDLALILSKDGNPDLYIMRLDDGALTRLTTTPGAVEASPSWSPDGRQIVYVSDQAGNPNLFVISRSGGSPRQITTRNRQNVAPDWGPHGEIVYASLIGRRFQICVINPQTGEIRQITNDNNADHEDPSWAPNGRHIACAKTSQFRSKVYLIDSMGDAPILLTDYDGDWFSPKWSP